MQSSLSSSATTTASAARAMQAVRAYVTAQDATHRDSLPPDIVCVDVTHSNLQQRHVEIRLNRSDSIETLRDIIYRKTGTPHAYQHLQFYDGADNFVAELAPSQSSPYKIGYFLPTHGYVVHCIDTNPYSISKNGALENVHLVPKFELTDEQYRARSNTLHAWKQTQKSIDPSFTYQKHAAEHAAYQHAIQCQKRGLPLPDGFEIVGGRVQKSNVQKNDTDNQRHDEPESIAQVQNIGDRCQIVIGKRRGTIAWKGEIPKLGGYWVGIRLDEPVGKNDGTFDGVRYFDCGPPGNKYGIFVRGDNVQVGNFPERDIFEDDEEDDDEDEL
jgi:tubulin-folding cofactor B